jgi:hypothetical protein
MYSSLDRVDIVTAAPGGGRRYVQTDHREASEIESEPELATLMALVRVLNPLRFSEDDGPTPEVVHYASHTPPPFLRRALASVGATLVVGPDPSGPPLAYDASLGAIADVDALVDETFGALARRTAESVELSLTLPGLETYERALVADGPPSADDNEARYWASVLKLGAFTGELLRGTNGGRWAQSNSSNGNLPFVMLASFTGQAATVNPLGKAIKYFAQGEQDAPSGLVRTLQAKP